MRRQSINIALLRSRGVATCVDTNGTSPWHLFKTKMEIIAPLVIQILGCIITDFPKFDKEHNYE